MKLVTHSPRQSVADTGDEPYAATKHIIVIRASGEPFVGDSWSWEVDVLVDGEDVGGGTAPTASGVLDVAMNVLYGDTNDHLNDDFGALSRLTKGSNG